MTNGEIFVHQQNGDVGGVHPVDGLHAGLHFCLPFEHSLDGVRHGWSPRVSSILVVLSRHTFSDAWMIGLTMTTMTDVKALSHNIIFGLLNGSRYSSSNSPYLIQFWPTGSS